MWQRTPCLFIHHDHFLTRTQFVQGPYVTYFKDKSECNSRNSNEKLDEKSTIYARDIVDVHIQSSGSKEARFFIEVSSTGKKVSLRARSHALANDWISCLKEMMATSKGASEAPEKDDVPKVDPQETDAMKRVEKSLMDGLLKLTRMFSREENKERQAEYMKEYVKTHREQKKEYNRRYREKQKNK